MAASRPRGAKPRRRLFCLPPNMTLPFYIVCVALFSMFFLTIVLTLHLYATSDFRIDSLLNSLTLEEKIGQMIQLSISHRTDPSGDAAIAVPDGFSFGTYKIGSLLDSWAGRCPTQYEWASLRSHLDGVFKQIPMKVPVLFGSDSINFVSNWTIFPQNIGMAATFNLSLIRRQGQVAASAARSIGTPWVRAPTLDIACDPVSSGFFDSYGEDPLLVAECAAAIINGVQAKRDVVATARGFVGGGAGVRAVLSGSDLREYHLAPFQKVIESGVSVVDVSPIMVNGLPVVADKAMLTRVLKEELQFQGMVVADMAAVAALHKHARIAPSMKDALKMAINAGVDMLTIPKNLSVYADLVTLVQEREIPMWRVDDAVQRILKVKSRAGLFRKFQKRPRIEDPHPIAYEAAVESITLLKNTGNILPIAPGTKLLVSGPNANSTSALGCNLSACLTICEAIQAANGHDFTFCEPSGNSGDGLPAKVNSVDVVVVAVGEDAYPRDEGPLPDLALPEEQVKLVKALIGTGKPIVMVINSGRPRVLGGLVQKVAAVIVIYVPGTFGGIALADALFGKVNPSGKLPFTYPKYRNTLMPYWHKWSEEATRQPRAPDNPTSFRPEFEFGFGLSYTTFQYSNLSISRPKFKDGEKLRVSVVVANNGTRAGREVVMLYTSDVTASLTPDVKRLRRFKKIQLDVGAMRIVQFDLGAEDFSFVNAEGMRVTEKGNFRIAVGGLNSTVYFE